MRVATRRSIGKSASVAVAADWYTIAGQTCVAAYKPIGESVLAASYINLAQPGVYDAAPGVAPTLGAAGWVFDGATQYLTTGIVPVSGWSALVRYSDAGISTNGIIGMLVLEAYWAIWPRYDNGNMYVQWGNGYATTTANTAGVAGITLTAGYFNGNSFGSFTAGAIPSLPIFIGGYNSNGTPMLSPVTIAALAIYSSTLSAADVAALTVKMQNLT